MRTFFYALTILSYLSAAGQEIANPALKSMVEAERAFVQMAKDQNTRDAFLFYLSDDAVTSGPEGIRKGKEHIRKQPVGNGWLYWEVAYSDIAASGNFGFNTGPWEFHRTKSDEKAVAFGEFNSVWRRGADGVWKNVLDIGISHGEPTEKPTWATTVKPSKALKKRSAGSVSGLLKVERAFIAAAAKDQKAAYEKNVSPEARLLRAGNLPFIYSRDGITFLDKVPQPAGVTLIDGESATSGDMGYVYGSADITALKEGKTETKKAAYFRVWKKEDGRTWKIVLDVLSY